MSKWEILVMLTHTSRSCRDLSAVSEGTDLFHGVGADVAFP